jgi:GAF domain-containing protein
VKAQSLHRIRELFEVLERTTGDPGDLTGTLQHITQTAQTFFAADDCVILAINPISGRFIASLTVAGDLLEEQVSFEQPRPHGNTQEVLRQGLLLVEDLEVTPEHHSTFTRLEGIRSFAGLALRTKYAQKPLGVLYLNFRQPRKFSFDEQELFQLFADQASYILQETWLLQRYQEVARIGQEINHELSTADNLFQKLQKYVGNILDTSYALLLAVYQAQTNTLDLHLEEEGHFIFLENDPLEGACQYVIETLKPLFIQQISKEAETLPFKTVEIITEAGSKESLIFVPLVLRDVPLGVLSIQHPQPNAYNQEDLFILQLLANHIALALHNLRLYENLSRLNETGQLLTQQLDSEQVLQATADNIQTATKADVVVLYPYEPTLRRFVLPPRIAGTLLDSTSLRSPYIRPNGIVYLALHHEKPIFAKESATIYNILWGDDHIRQESFGQREKMRSTAIVPLQVGDESVGVLFVNFRQPQRFDATQKLFIEGLAYYAAIAIKNAQVFGTLIQRRMHELEILQKIDRELNRTLDLESVLNTLLRLAHEHVPAEEASILLYNPRTQTLETTTAIGRHAEISRKQTISLQETKAITRWVLEEKKPAKVNNVHQDLPWRDLHLPVATDTISELDVPLLDGDEVVGVFNFESVKEGAFHLEDQDFLITLAGQAVLAIKKAQAYEREKRLVEEGQVLNEISKEITSQLDLDHVFDLILEKALELTHSTTGNLMLYVPDKHDLWMAAERGVAEDNKGKRLNLDQGIAGYVATKKQWLNVDPSQPPWNEIYLDYIPGTRSELAVPMLAGSDIRGVLNVESPSPNNFNESDERLLQGLADLAVVALQNAQAYEREKRLVAEAQVLNEISQEITSQLDLNHVFDLILVKALELTHSTLGSLHLYDPHLNELYMVAERGVAEDKKGRHQKLGEGIVGYVAKQQQLQNVEDVTQTPWSKIYQEFFPGARSELAIPMLAGDELRGVLNIESPSLNNFSESDERLLQGLADLAVVALQNAERYKEAEKEAQRMKLLYQAGQELSKITDLEQLEQAYEIAVQIADEQSQSQAVIYSLDETNTELMLKYKSPDRDAPLFERIKLDEGISGQVARERRTIVVRDADNLPPGIGPVKQSDSRMRSLVVTPIMFKDQYYGNLGLRHQAVSHFRQADILLYEGLAQLLASTIYRLETAQARQEFEQRAVSTEEMGSIGQSAYEVTHRLGNDLGLVESYVGDIQLELESLGVNSRFVSRKLENIVQAVRTVLDLSRDLKQQLANLGATDEAAGEPVIISPRLLLEEMQTHTVPLLPSNIQIYTEIEADVASIQVIPGSIDDVLRNLIANAIQAMPKGGQIALRARNVGRYVALEVADTGVGIPPEKQSKIFDLFFSTKGSSGFGLWSARRNILKNRGEIKVDSKPDEGTTFILFLPRMNGVIREQHEALLQQPANPGD